MLTNETYNPEYLKIKNGHVKEGIFKNRSCFDKCKKKGYCEAGIMGMCDIKNYCTPVNAEYTASERSSKQHCEPPSQSSGEIPEIPEFIDNRRENMIDRLASRDLGITEIAFNPKKVETLRSRTTPEKDYELFKPIIFNGLQITYIGSNSNRHGTRDMIIVKFVPYMIDIGGRVKNTQVFYRSTGRNSGVKNSWFPFNGIVSPGILFDKGGKLPGPKKKRLQTLSQYRPSWEIISPLDGGDSPLFYNYGKSVNKNCGGGAYCKTVNRKWQDLKNIVERFSYDKFMEISLILGGGQLWEEDEDGVYLRNLYFKNKHLVKKTYDIPSTRIKLSSVQINSIIGPHTEYGVDINKDFFKFQNNIEPYSNIIETISFIGSLGRGITEEDCQKHKYNYEVVKKLYSLMNSLEQKYKHRGNDENKASFSHGAGNALGEHVKRYKSDIGLPSGNILWMYAITNTEEKKNLIELLANTIDGHSHSEINTDYITGKYTFYTHGSKTIDLAKQDPSILGVKTWLDLSTNNVSKYKSSEKVNKGGTRKKKNKRNKTKKKKCKKLRKTKCKRKK